MEGGATRLRRRRRRTTTTTTINLSLLFLFGTFSVLLLFIAQSRHPTKSIYSCEASTPPSFANGSVVLLTYVSSSSSSPPPPSSSQSDSCFENWRSSAIRSGFSPADIVVIRGPRWDTASAEINWLRRNEAYTVQLQTFPPNQPVFLTDAFDVLIAAPPLRLLEAYSLAGARIVFGAETLCDTPACRRDPLSRERMKRRAAEQGQFKNSDFVFLNAGTVMGRAEDLTALMTHAIAYQRSHPGSDDQAAYVDFWLTSAADVSTLDYQSRLVAIISPQSNPDHYSLDAKSNLIRNLPEGETSARPCCYHFASMKPRQIAESSLSASNVKPFSFCEEELVQYYNFIGTRLDQRRLRTPPAIYNATVKCGEKYRQFVPVRRVFGGKRLRNGWHAYLDRATSKCNRVAPQSGRLKLKSGPWEVLRPLDFLVATSDEFDLDKKCGLIVWRRRFAVPAVRTFPSADHSLYFLLDVDGALKLNIAIISSANKWEVWRQLWSSSDDSSRSEVSASTITDRSFYATIYEEKLVVIRGKAPSGTPEEMRSPAKEKLARHIWSADMKINNNYRIIGSFSPLELAGGDNRTDHGNVPGSNAHLELMLRWQENTARSTTGSTLPSVAVLELWRCGSEYMRSEI